MVLELAMLGSDSIKINFDRLLLTVDWRHYVS